ncbi:MAG: TMEM43 family protein [Candidatus Moraniibacteriota bacterium]|jgi:transmembrane protein TMEM43
MSTVTTSESWGSRLGGSIKGILFGVLLLIAAIVLLFWNEGRAVHTKKALDEGQSMVENASIEQIDPGQDGKLVHLNGKLETKDVLEDSQFGVVFEGIKLKRLVEMYQWEENTDSSSTKKMGGSTETTTTYTYNKDWNSSLIDSGGFHDQGHDNPGIMMYESDTLSAGNVQLGKFKLSESLINKIGNYKNFPVVEMKKEVSEDDSIKLIGGIIYIGEDQNNPKIGDLKISYQTVSPEVVSMISQQKGDSFKPFVTSKGQTLEFLTSRDQTAQQMFDSAKSSNKLMTWILRFVGFFMIMIGTKIILKPLEVIGDVVPFIGNIIGFGIGIMSFIAAVQISLLTIAIAWIFYRPMFAIMLILVCVALGVFVWYKMKQNKE